ncbi:MAG: hypothetical protein GXP23_01330 [Gammaproteobacteria bacterium]|nr:hypothetical protein [Gammaproteobacteria bacterium]
MKTIKANSRHAGEGRYPAVSTTYWIPGQARHDDVALTGQQYFRDYILRVT